jgi:hypothetical protein
MTISKGFDQDGFIIEDLTDEQWAQLNGEAPASEAAGAEDIIFEQPASESIVIHSEKVSDAVPFSEGYDPASIYESLQTGTWIQWGFETQVGTPIDGSSTHLRNLSPFIIRVVPPAAFVAENSDLDYDPNLLNLANSQSQLSADSRTLTGEGFLGFDSTDALEQIISAGRLISSAGGPEEVSVITDIYTYADIALQVQGMVKTPPLRLLVNPQELSITHTSIQEYQNRSRAGYIFQRWGTAQPKLSIKGSTGSFITGAPPGTVGNSVASEGEIWERFQRSTEIPCATGVQWASRRDSAAWQNFMALYHFYRNGGIVYDTVRGSCAHHAVGAIAIDYDQWTYVGTIDSFNFSFQEGLPHRVEWSMEFTVSEMYDHATAPSFVLPMKTAQTASFSDALKQKQGSVALASGARTDYGDLEGRDRILRSTMDYGQERPTGPGNDGRPPPDLGGFDTDTTGDTPEDDTGAEAVEASGGAALAVRYNTEGVYPFTLLQG